MVIGLNVMKHLNLVIILILSLIFHYKYLRMLHYHPQKIIHKWQRLHHLKNKHVRRKYPEMIFTWLILFSYSTKSYGWYDVKTKWLSISLTVRSIMFFTITSPSWYFEGSSSSRHEPAVSIALNLKPIEIILHKL